MKKKQILCFILIFCCILYGCSQKKDIEETSNPLKGRYVEKSLPLPAEVTGDFIQLTKKDQKPLLYIFNESTFVIAGYQLESDGTWTEVTPEWIKSIPSLPKGWAYQPRFMEDSNGYQYLYYFELTDTSLIANLLCSKDGTTYEALHPEGWEDSYPARIAVMEDGTIAATFYNNEVKLYSSTDQKLLSTLSDLTYHSDFLDTMGTKLILGEDDENYRIKNIVVYDTSLQSSTSYPYEATIDTYTETYSDHNNQDILLCNTDGIFKLEEDTSLWNCVLDGTLTSLAMPTMYYHGFAADAFDNYYVLYSNSNNGYSLMQYTFDEELDAIPSNELNIYALTDSSTLRQAAAVFQQKNTNVKVNFTIAMTKEEYESADMATKDDYIRALNTELLAGSNYDILILDGLPADSLIEKGVLADISDLLQPMIKDGTLYKNIMDNYDQEGKIYRVPARFSVSMLFGNTEDIDKLSSLETLAEYASTHTDAPMFGSITLEHLIDTFLPYEISGLFDHQDKINRDNLIRTLNSLKLISDRCGLLEAYDRYSYAIPGNNIWNLLNGEYLALYTPQSFLAIESFGMVKHTNGYYTSYENSFIPNCELGINSKSVQPELGKEFIKTILSEEIQVNDLYDGFPINSKALIASSLKDRSDYCAGSTVKNEDGSETTVNFGALDKQQTEDLVSICSSVTKKAVINEHITDAVRERAAKFFTGEISAEAAADAIIEKLNVYLSE